MAASQGLMHLVNIALDHGMQHIQDGITKFIPFIIVEEGTERELRRIVRGDLQTAVHLGELSALSALTSSNLVVLCYDGRLTINGVKTDAVITKAYEGKRYHIFAQRYRGTQELGNISYPERGDL